MILIVHFKLCMISTYRFASFRIAFALKSPANMIPLETLINAIPSVLPDLKLLSKSPPWAPMPGIRNGKSFTTFLICEISVADVPPTTSPRLSLLLSFFTNFATDSKSVSPLLFISWKSPADALDVLQRTNTPLCCYDFRQRFVWRF